MPKQAVQKKNSFVPSSQSELAREVKYEKINVPEIMERVNSLIKEKMKGHYSPNNCGYLTEFTITTLTELLLGLPLTDRDISLESSIETTTPCKIRQGFVKIKEEKSNNVLKRQLRVVHSTAIRTQAGLHSILPPHETRLIHIDEHSTTENPYIDLENHAVPRTMVKSFQLHQELTTQARESNSILVGHIALATLGKSPKGHAFAFCATDEMVYFIDGQLYNGLTDQGETLFYDIQTSNLFTGFADDCFYLIHRKLPTTYQPLPQQTIPSAPTEKSMEKNESELRSKCDATVLAKKRKRSETSDADLSDVFAQNHTDNKKNHPDSSNCSLPEMNCKFEDIIKKANRKDKKSAIQLFSQALDLITEQKKHFPTNHQLRERSIYCQFSIIKCQLAAGWTSLLSPEISARLEELNKDIKQIHDEYMLIRNYQRNKLICSRYHNTSNSIKYLLLDTESKTKVGTSAYQFAANIFNILQNKGDMSHFIHSFPHPPSRKQWLEFALEQAEAGIDCHYDLEKQSQNLNLINNIKKQLQKCTIRFERGFFAGNKPSMEEESEMRILNRPPING